MKRINRVDWDLRHDQTQAIKQGSQAHQNGKPLSDNPWTKQSLQWDCWAIGWKRAANGHPNDFRIA